MPSGYRVIPDDGRLGPGNTITSPLTVFITEVVIGVGEWRWSGTAESASFADTIEPGVYHQARDSHLYFVPELGPATSIISANVDAAPAFDIAFCGSGERTEAVSHIDEDTLDASLAEDRTPGGGGAVDAFHLDGFVAQENSRSASARAKPAPRSFATTRSDSVADGELDSKAIICFSEGTWIQTPHGERRIESLRPGDFAQTVDHGPQPIRWIGRKTVRATGTLAPVCFRKGTVGNHRDLLVSPQHRMLFQGPSAQRLFGRSEVLAPAQSLVDDYQVAVRYGGMITYVHMLFDQHEVVVANGAPSESFHPGGQGLDTLSAASRDELFSVFPALRSDTGSYGPASRHCVGGSDARALAMA